jgi:hypothetical protein
VNWSERHAFGSHQGKWLAVALVVLPLLALCIALLSLVLGLFRRKGDTDESDYWRIHGG